MILVEIEIKLNTIKPSEDGGRTAGSYLRSPDIWYYHISDWNGAKKDILAFLS